MYFIFANLCIRRAPESMLRVAECDQPAAGDLRLSGLLSGHISQVQGTHGDNYPHLFTFSTSCDQNDERYVFVAPAYNIALTLLWQRSFHRYILVGQFGQQYFQSSSWPFLLHILGQMFSCLAFWLTTDATKLFVSLSLCEGKPMEPGKLAHLRWEMYKWHCSKGETYV